MTGERPRECAHCCSSSLRLWLCGFSFNSHEDRPIVGRAESLALECLFSDGNSRHRARVRRHLSKFGYQVSHVGQFRYELFGSGHVSCGIAGTLV